MSMNKLSIKQMTLCEQLFEIGAIKFGNYRLKLHDDYPDAPLSPIYCDLRAVQHEPHTDKLAVEIYYDMLKDLDFDLLAGIPLAAVSFTSSLKNKFYKGMITPRTDNKTHGSGAKIDGFFESDVGKKVVLIDDLITKANSKIEAATILRDSGIIVTDVVVLIDRNQGGREQLAEIGLELHSAILLDDMLDYYLETGTISKETYDDTVKRLEELTKYSK